MKNCAICNKAFPNRILVDGKYRNTQRRRYCLECSPFGGHNTIKLEEKNTNNCLTCNNKLNNRQKMYCSKECKKKDHSYYASQKKRGIERKIKLVLIKGGCCSECGYNKNLAALEFHHVNPKEKETQLDARTLTNRTWEFILKEAEKCILICSNCHAEHHNPSLSGWKMSQERIELSLKA